MKLKQFLYQFLYSRTILVTFLVIFDLLLNNFANARPSKTIRQKRSTEGSPKNRTGSRILTHLGHGGHTDSSSSNFFGENPTPDIIFPDSYETADFSPVPRISGTPPCADGLTFCENFEGYPYRQVKELLKENPTYKELFGEDEAPKTITNRLGDDKEEFVCGSIERTIYPRIGKNKNNKWKYIINQGEEDGFVQGVRIETCRREGSPCNVIGDIPNGYRTFCKQKYIYRRMLSLNENGVQVPDTFLIPSACCCAYKSYVDFLARSLPVTPVPSI